MRRLAAALLLAASAAHGQEAGERAKPAPRPPVVKAQNAAPQAPGPQAPGPTPLGERVATIAALDKLNGVIRQFEMRPGDAVQFGRLTIRLRACETTPPWDPKPETGAFAQVFERAARSDRVARVFSGWMFASSPSLNPFENDAYDVWVRKCAMRFPDSGPETVSAGSLGGSPVSASSKAKKSARRETAPDSNAL